MDFAVRQMMVRDWAAVREIYGEGIATGKATFEIALPEWQKWDSAHRPDCRLIAECGSRAIGWAALVPISMRRVYSGVAEVSVYVAESARKNGVGRALLKTLIDESERCGIWTLQAGIFPENHASLALHKSLGFREVGVRRRIGQLRNVWKDVLLLERRSSIAGV
jgi:L-amino acid N-acyltransferase YncA